MPAAFACLLALVLAAACVVPAPLAHAASGTVYSCEVVPSYKHPATGEVADSGGKAAQATGQAMVESCLSKKGMLEQTDSGKYYLTIRLSLIDYTNGHEFRVQKWGGSGWSKPRVGVTAEGSDKNGTTNDVCIQVPAKKSVVRVSMFVESMGRDVVFFCYPSKLEKGKPKGFKATRVTAASGAASSAKADDAGSASKEGSAKAAESADAADVPGDSDAGIAAGGSGDGGSSDGDAAGEGEGATDGDGSSELDDGQVSSAQGLSLSTAGAADAQGPQGSADDAAALASGSTPASAGSVLFGILVAAAPGLILILVAAFIVYRFVKNWNRWRGSDPDDYSSEYEDEPW